MSWHTGRLAAFDLETTAPDPEAARIVTACVAWRLGQTHERLGRVDARGLHLLQVGWAVDQAESLSAYFRRTPGKEQWADGVRVEWPLIPHQNGGAA